MYDPDVKINLKSFPEQLTTKEAADALGLTRAALDLQLSRGTLIIPFIKIGRARRFLKKDVEQYLSREYEQAHANLKKAS